MNNNLPGVLFKNGFITGNRREHNTAAYYGLLHLLLMSQLTPNHRVVSYRIIVCVFVCVFILSCVIKTLPQRKSDLINSFIQILLA